MNRDFKDLLSEFSRHGVEHMIIGAHAAAAYGHLRSTKDLDVWVNATPLNAERIVSALREFGAPMNELNPADFAQPGITFQIGVDPVRIDVCTQIDGVDFSDAWPRRATHALDELMVPVINKADLIINKKTVGRPQDLIDVAALEKLEPL